MIKRFFGVTIAVKDFDAAVKKYGDVLGIKPEFAKPGDFASPGLKGAMFNVGGVLITIMASAKPDTSIAKFVETRGEGVFLLSLEVTDTAQATKELTEKGVKFVSDKPLPFSGGVANFSHPKSMHGVQFEFIQPHPDSWLTNILCLERAKMIKRFGGVSIAVKDFEAAVKKYGDVLGVKPEFTKPGFFPFPGIKGAIFKIGDVRLYLVASEQPDTSIAKFVATRGEGVFLLSLEVTDVEQDTKELTKKGVKFVSDTPLTLETATVNFAHPKSMHGVQVEFMQPVPGMLE